MHITPKLRAGLRAIAASPTHRLVRVRGGYCPEGAPGPVITTRTVNAMERSYLVSFDGLYAAQVELTSKGRRLAYQGEAKAAGGVA